MSGTTKLALAVIDCARDNDEVRKDPWPGERTRFLPMGIPACGIVPSGVLHTVRNTGSGMLKLFTPYSPRRHGRGTEHAGKAPAPAEE